MMNTYEEKDHHFFSGYMYNFNESEGVE